MRARLLPPALALVAAALGRVTPVYAAPPPATAPAAAPAAVIVDEQSEFEKGRNAYRAQKYDEADVTEKHSRWVALAPFGFGQFQNGQRGLGVFFLAADSLLLAGEIAAVP